MFKQILLVIVLSVTISEILLPDLRPTKITDLQINDDGQLAFTTTIGNVGRGPFEVASDRNLASDPTDTTQTSTATQQLYDETGRVANTLVIGHFEFHPTHQHWHLDAVERYAVHTAEDDGTGGRLGSMVSNVGTLKVSFCLEDSAPLTPDVSADPKYTQCAGKVQGISPGFGDVYGYYLDGQSINPTTLEDGVVYYLVNTVNPSKIYKESDYGNNVGWASFKLSTSDDTRDVQVIGYSKCEDLAGMCGENIPTDLPDPSTG
jgi:hypothetical protein